MSDAVAATAWEAVWIWGGGCEILCMILANEGGRPDGRFQKVDDIQLGRRSGVLCEAGGGEAKFSGLTLT
jgi:hypothetical protein